MSGAPQTRKRSRWGETSGKGLGVEMDEDGRRYDKAYGGDCGKPDDFSPWPLAALSTGPGRRRCLPEPCQEEDGHDQDGRDVPYTGQGRRHGESHDEQGLEEVPDRRFHVLAIRSPEFRKVHAHEGGGGGQEQLGQLGGLNAHQAPLGPEEDLRYDQRGPEDEQSDSQGMPSAPLLCGKRVPKISQVAGHGNRRDSDQKTRWHKHQGALADGVQPSGIVRARRQLEKDQGPETGQKISDAKQAACNLVSCPFDREKQRGPRPPAPGEEQQMGQVQRQAAVPQRREKKNGCGRRKYGGEKSGGRSLFSPFAPFGKNRREKTNRDGRQKRPGNRDDSPQGPVGQAFPLAEPRRFFCRSRRRSGTARFDSLLLPNFVFLVPRVLRIVFEPQVDVSFGSKNKAAVFSDRNAVVGSTGHDSFDALRPFARRAFVALWLDGEEDAPETLDRTVFFPHLHQGAVMSGAEEERVPPAVHPCRVRGGFRFSTGRGRRCSLRWKTGGLPFSLASPRFSASCGLSKQNVS